jgi:hypothetical protein
MRFFFATHLRPVSTFVALSRGLQNVYPVAQDLPDSIARAFARLDSSPKSRPPRNSLDEKVETKHPA